MSDPAEQLRALENDSLLRKLRPMQSSQGVAVVRDGRTLHNFSSNDYLGLTTNEAIKAAFQEGIERWGHGAGASRLITGTQLPHSDFEQRFAAAKGAPAALLFSSGYALALGVIPVVVGNNDFIVLDKLCHACLIDGARLSGATVRVFPHNRLEKLEQLLKSIREKNTTSRILVVTESVFSMDGDLCPLREIVALKERYGALLLLDEAHGFGVLGATGMGLAEELGLQTEVDFQMSTLSKAAGLFGACLATSRDWCDLFVNGARSFVFSTALPGALAQAATESLRIIQSSHGSDLRQTLRANTSILGSSPSPITPIVIGSSSAALSVSANLEEKGLLVPAIRYPTVPRHTARLRVSLSAEHDRGVVLNLRDQLERLVNRS